MGEIYDHHKEKRDNLVRDAIKEIEANGEDPRVVLEAMRKDSEVVNGYLTDHPFESPPKVEAPSTDR